MGHYVFALKSTECGDVPGSMAAFFGGVDFISGEHLSMASDN
jgi:hypothetical protein